MAKSGKRKWSEWSTVPNKYIPDEITPHLYPTREESSKHVDRTWKRIVNQYGASTILSSPPDRAVREKAQIQMRIHGRKYISALQKKISKGETPTIGEMLTAEMYKSYSGADITSPVTPTPYDIISSLAQEIHQMHGGIAHLQKQISMLSQTLMSSIPETEKDEKDLREIEQLDEGRGPPGFWNVSTTDIDECSDDKEKDESKSVLWGSSDSEDIEDVEDDESSKRDPDPISGEEDSEDKL